MPDRLSGHRAIAADASCVPAKGYWLPTPDRETANCRAAIVAVWGRLHRIKLLDKWKDDQARCEIDRPRRKYSVIPADTKSSESPLLELSHIRTIGFEGSLLVRPFLKFGAFQH
jgi:hypothetical protein